MNRFIDRLKLIFLVIFAVGCVGSWTYQLMYAVPQARCEGRGGWWDWRGRQCAIPMPLYVLTGRHAERLAPGARTPKGPSAPAGVVPEAAGPKARP